MRSPVGISTGFLVAMFFVTVHGHATGPAVGGETAPKPKVCNHEADVFAACDRLHYFISNNVCMRATCTKVCVPDKTKPKLDSYRIETVASHPDLCRRGMNPTSVDEELDLLYEEAEQNYEAGEVLVDPDQFGLDGAPVVSPENDMLLTP